ncbi:MAG TPA: tetratricopeptide repeat protein [Thermodesulfovibrionales bacterium]|nr:tetratricopeptide repeat protein [Thermodesulfovibrionales bacterium]
MIDKSVIVKEAQKYLARGQIDKAIIEWEKLVKEAPDGNVYNTVGDLYLKKGNKKSAVDFFHRSATFFREGGFSLKALALYKKVINIDPLDTGAFTALGELSEEKGLVTDAIKYYLTAADILSRDASKERFVSIYERILSLAPSNLSLRDKVAGLFLKEGLTSHAVKEFLSLADLCAEKEDWEQGRSYYVKILDIQPDNKNALAGMSSVYEKRGDVKQAIEFMKKAIAAQRDDPRLLMRCALLFKDSGAYDEAINCLSPVIETMPTDMEATTLMGDIHLARGDRRKAWESYKKVVDSLVLTNKHDDAIDLMKRFKDIDPIPIGKMLISLYKQIGKVDTEFSEILFVADLLLESGLRDEAVEYYKEALAIRPDDIQIKRILAEQEMGTLGMATLTAEGGKSTEDLFADADIFMKYGLRDEARIMLEGLKVKEPGNTEIHRRLKSLYREMNDSEQAITECLILAELYGRNGDSDMREAALGEAFEINPDDPRLLERAALRSEKPSPAQVAEKPSLESLDDYAEEIAEAEFYARQGLKDDALRIYHKLLAIFPQESTLVEKVSSLDGGAPESNVGSGGLSAEASVEPPREDFLSPESDVFEADELHDRGEPSLDTNVLDIFEEFKKGLEKELEAEDFETHYNLGIAYKEMGLMDDAIKEFQTSKNDPRCSARSMTMLGICYMEKGLFSLAIEAFKEALSGLTTRDESYWSAKYDLASAYEKNGSLKEAFQIFSEIYGMDSKFRQVNEKLDHLKLLLAGEEQSPPQKEKKDRVSYI